MNQYNPYLSPYLTPNIQPNMAPMQNVLPPQQIMQAAGRDSVNSIKLSPNSSVLIADATRPIIYKCISDSIGTTSIEAFDVMPHKDEEEVKRDNIEVMLSDLKTRVERLENESNTRWSQSESSHAEYIENETHSSDDEIAVKS